MFVINHRLSTDGQELITTYDEVYDTFDAMGLQENLLRGIYAYGIWMTFLFVSLTTYLLYYVTMLVSNYGSVL